MNIDLENNLPNQSEKNEFVQKFAKEISHFLQEKLNANKESKPILQTILETNKLTIGNENEMRCEFEKIVSTYVNQNNNIYFVKDDKKAYWKNNKRYFNYEVYSVIKGNGEGIEEIEINKLDMPKSIGVNDTFKIENNQYLLDNNIAEQIKKETTNMAKEILEKQNGNLEKHRIEGNLYMVAGESGNSRFLVDLMKKTKIQFEEVKFSEALLSKLVEGSVVKYHNGNYEYYSDDGFERIEE